MKSSFYKITGTVLLVCMSMLVHTSGSAQMYHFGLSKFKYKKGLPKRQNNRPFAAIHLGYNHTLPYNVHFFHYFAGNDLEGRHISEFEYRRSVLATPGPSISLGTHFPFYDISEKFTVAFTLGAEYNSVIANTGTVNISPFSSYSAELSQSKISLPFGVAIKYGADASLVRSDRFSGSFGIAAAPSYVTTKFGDYFTDASFTVSPFIFAEVGVMAGFNWKLRATCMPLGITGFKRSPGDDGMDAFPTQTSIRATSDAIFQVGIAIQPMAFLWDKYHW